MAAIGTNPTCDPVQRMSDDEVLNGPARTSFLISHDRTHIAHARTCNFFVRGGRRDRQRLDFGFRETQPFAKVHSVPKFNRKKSVRAKSGDTFNAQAPRSLQ